MKNKITIIICMGLLLLIQTFSICAQPCSLDTTFNTFDPGFGMGDGFGDQTTALELQPDGKLIALGIFPTYNQISRPCIIRLNTDGSLDPSFNPGTGFNTFVYSSVLQPDGKIVAGGQFTNYNGTTRNRVARINPDGTIDPTFNPGLGFNTTGNNIWSLELQPDGKIIAGGVFTAYNGTTGINRIVRIKPNGNMDSSFITGTGFNTTVKVVRLQPDGKILVGGDFTSFNGATGINRIIRLNADGSLDASFNSGAGFDQSVNDILVQPDGKIVIGGLFTSFNGTPGVNRIVRLNTDGSIDPTFNTGSGFDNGLLKLMLLPSGQVAAGGYFTEYNGAVNRNRMAILNPDGTMDISFNSGIGFDGTSTPNYVADMVLQSDGKILVGGKINGFNTEFKINFISRLHADGNIDNNYNPQKGFNRMTHAICLQPDGKILVGGYFTAFNNVGRKRICRLNQDGSIDSTFNPGIGFDDAVLTIHLQPDGKILVGGWFNSFNGVSGIYQIVRLNADGSLDNTFTGGTGISGMGYHINDIAIQPDGKIIAVGFFYYFNGVPIMADMVRLNPDGSFDNTFPNGNPFNGEPYTVDLQTDGKIVVGGDFDEYYGTSCKRIVRLNTDGTIDNSFNTGTGFDDRVLSVEIHPDGKISAGGYFTTCNGTPRKRIARLNPDGSLDLSFNSSVGFNNPVQDHDVQPDGKILVIGTFTSYNGITRNRLCRINTDGSLDASFDPGPGFTNSTPVPTLYDVEMAPNGSIYYAGAFYSFNGKGKNRFARMFGGDLSLGVVPDTLLCKGQILDIPYSASGHYELGNNFNIELSDSIGNFTSPTVIGSVTDTTSGMINVTIPLNIYPNNHYRIRVASTHPIVVSTSNQFDLVIADNHHVINSTACDSTTIHGITYHSSGTYQQVIPNPISCDSIFTLHLTINNNSDSSLTLVDCGSISVNSQVYTTSGVYSQLLTNSTGCDSLLTLNLTVNNPTSSFFNENACDSFIFNSQLYTASGTYSQTLTNMAGCDSNITLNLQLHNNSSSLNIAGCDMVTVNNNHYYATGTYAQTLTNSMGCDSLLIIHVTINTVDASVSTAGHTLTANAAGANYQWVNCNNNYAPIPLATNQVYVATVNGNYAVIVTDNGCTDTSACFGVFDFGLNNPSDPGEITMMPNPTFGSVKISSTSTDITGIYILNEMGQMMNTSFTQSGGDIWLDVSTYSPGIYFVEVRCSEKIFRFKLIKI